VVLPSGADFSFNDEFEELADNASATIPASRALAELRYSTESEGFRYALKR
jgi:hypothetical protein